MDRVFVDTGAFIALAASMDLNHNSAKAVYQSLLDARVPLITSNHILDETCTWLVRDRTMGQRAALAFGAFLEANAEPFDGAMAGSRRFKIVYSTSDIEREAWQILQTYDTVSLSFTDCVSFAVMKKLGVSRAFTYDSHFDIAGFQRIG